MAVVHDGRALTLTAGDWVTAADEKWISERRGIEAAIGTDSWSLDLTFELRNARGEVLEFGSPAVFGREMAGYCGFFWRGPHSFTGGSVLASDGQAGPELMGSRADWPAFAGAHDEVDRSSTLLFKLRYRLVMDFHRL
jgi:hypothetical protein